MWKAKASAFTAVQFEEETSHTCIIPVCKDHTWSYNLPIWRLLQTLANCFAELVQNALKISTLEDAFSQQLHQLVLVRVHTKLQVEMFA